MISHLLTIDGQNKGFWEEIRGFLEIVFLDKSLEKYFWWS